MSQNEEYRYVSEARRRHKKKKKSSAGRVILAILCVVVVLGGAAAATWKILSDKFTASYIKQDTAGNLVESIENTPSEYQGKQVTILVAGIANDPEDEDYEYGGGKGLTDIVMYVSYDVANNQMSVLQIPRDTYVGANVGGSSTGKINAVYANGQHQDNLISNLAEIINTQYQLPVDYYVTIDIKSFTEIIDILGGIDMYLPYDIYDDAGNTLPAGTHHLDGATARWVLRQRHCYANADIGRLETQQFFYAACFKLFKTCSVKDITKTLLPVVAYRINTDMSFDTMTSLAMSLMKADPYKICMTKLLGGATMVGDQSVFICNAERSAAMLNQYFRPYGDPVPASELGVPTGIVPSSELDDNIKWLGDILGE